MKSELKYKGVFKMRQRQMKHISSLLLLGLIGAVSIPETSLAQSRRVDQKTFASRNVNVLVRHLSVRQDLPLMTFSPQDLAVGGAGCSAGEACQAHSVAFSIQQSTPTGSGVIAGLVLKFKYLVNDIVTETQELDLGTNPNLQYKMFQLKTPKDLNSGIHSIQVLAYSRMVSADSSVRWTTIQSVTPMMGISRASNVLQAMPAPVEAAVTGKYNVSTGRLPVTMRAAVRQDGAFMYSTEVSHFREDSIQSLTVGTQVVVSEYEPTSNPHSIYSLYSGAPVFDISLLSKIAVSPDSSNGATIAFSRVLPSRRAHYSVAIRSVDWLGRMGWNTTNYKVNVISKPVNAGGTTALNWGCHSMLMGTLKFKAPTTYDNSTSTLIKANELAGYMASLTNEANVNKNETRPAVMIPLSNVTLDPVSGVSEASFFFQDLYLDESNYRLKLCPIGSDKIEGLCEMIPVSIGPRPSPEVCDGGYGGW